MPGSPILVLAKIKEERGIRGHLKVISRGEFFSRYEINSKINVYSASAIKDGFLNQPGISRVYTIRSMESLTDETWDIKLEGIDTREDASLFAGKYIGMELNEARQKFHDPEDPYLFEYLNCEVFENDQKMGIVERVEDFNGKQWLVVNRNQKEIMIPLQGPFIKSFEVEQFRIILAENMGLFEFDETA